MALYTEMIPSKAERSVKYLTDLGQKYGALPTIPAEFHYQFARPSLLIGGTIDDTAHFDYIALADESVHSTATIWSCCGVLIPLEQNSLKTVIVSDVWKSLGVAFHSRV